MGDQRYEYRVHDVSIYPTELDSRRFEDVLNEAAADGWELDETITLGESTILFVFRRET
ncbi:hypothetical protein G9464_05450 [Halostella sp. JP-L12]|uniref:hypothetical protein n=1 Tax=Halostella TaxID=1843185 RepID=UPI0013CF330E|nr:MULTISPECIES: hypothetical protein [Halostella]NHN47042.1 hypothetical protein [Halostella sp. JP-L12]